MKSWKIPTPNQVDRAVALMGHSVHRRYFFDRLENPEWIEPLLAKGFFQHPPTAERDESQGTIGFPPWPESCYLARMASKKPELVLDVILKIPDTNNVRVHEDLSKAALTMPPHLSAVWAKKKVGWVRQQNHLFLVLPRELGKLIGHLSRGGEVDAALDLARALLEVLPDLKTREKAKEDEDDVYSLPPQPTVRFDQWEYGEILKKNIPELVRAAGVRAVELLCDLLEAAVTYSQSDGEEGAPEDYSWIWRPAVEHHPQNRHHGLRDVLMTSLGDACESTIREGKLRVRDLVIKLEGRPWRIFHRIALHLLRRHPDSVVDLIGERLTNRTLFDRSAYRHEYAMLLNECFSMLSDERQEVILEWIGEGPDLEQFMKEEDKLTGDRLTEEDGERYRKHWQSIRLAWFTAALPESWKKRYERLVAEIGEPEHPEFASYSRGGWVGPTSPKSAEELQGMTVSEIVKLCKAWQPSGESMAPSPEGLGRVLSSVVSEKPGQFSEGATKFQGLPPTYVRALLSGFRDALGKGQTFDWNPVFDLCGWVVKQPEEVANEGHEDMDKDPHWGWTRKTIADLLSTGFKEEDAGAIPFEYRETAWQILKPLTEDPDPTPEYEAQYGGSNMDPTTVSINTTRGEAMHAVVQYALWVRRYLEKEPDGKERLSLGFNEMPEIREVLEAHLDSSLDPSLAIRAVYGQWFPWLVLIDSRWAKENASRIFPAAEDRQAYWEAGWNAYVTRCQAYDDVFEALADQYALAIDRLSESAEEVDSYADPQASLGDHLMAFYWRGKLDLNEPEGLLNRFWEKASLAVKGKAIELVGRSLEDTKGVVPAKILDRLRQLWEKRLGAARSATDVEVFLPELKAFGWWFASGTFDDKWAIKQLLEALKLTQKTYPHHLVVERLTGVAEKMPLEAVQCLGHLAKGDREGWKIHGWIDEAKTILSHALKSGGKAAELAEDLVHYLGSRGYLQFRSLIQNE
jgi:hypothetical protein